MCEVEENHGIIDEKGPRGRSKEWDPERSGEINLDVEEPNAHPDRVPERKMVKMSLRGETGGIVANLSWRRNGINLYKYHR